MKAKTMIPCIGLLMGLVSQALGATATINIGTDYQKISGFGASTAWAGSMSAADAALLWDSTSGAGLTLHRIRIAPDGTTSETSIAKQAVAYGVKVWASPWSSNYTVVYGTNTDGSSKKHLDFTKAQLWANSILQFVHTMKNAGVPLYAVSSQNEPDGTGDDHYTEDSLALWIGSYLGPTIDTTGVKVIAPESVNWYSFPNFLTSIWNNANAKKYTSIVATHEYGGSPAAYPQIAQAGKEFWETEVYDMGSNVEDPGITSALRVAAVMHTALTVSNVNAWHFWWVYPCAAASCGNGALWSQGTNSKATKRLWIMGNYSRFVRPGFVRIGATDAPTSGVTMTAYRDQTKSKIVVVAIKTNSTATDQPLSFSGATPSKVTPYVTDGTRDLVAQSSQNLTTTSFTYSLPSKSVTTLVFNIGTASSSSSSATVSSSSVAKGPYGTRVVIPGTIQAENYDVGGEGVAYHDTDAVNEGNVYRTDGVDITGDTTNGYKVGWTVAGEWLEYSLSVSTAGVYVWSARVSMGGDSAAFHMAMDGTNITDRIQISNTGTWDDYTTISSNTIIPLTVGNHVLRISVDRSYANFDWISFNLLPTSLAPFQFGKIGITTAQIYDLQGRKMGEVRGGNTHELEMAVWSAYHRSGIYIVKQVSGQQTLTRKLVVKEP